MFDLLPLAENVGGNMVHKVGPYLAGCSVVPWVLACVARELVFPVNLFVRPPWKVGVLEPKKDGTVPAFCLSPLLVILTALAVVPAVRGSLG